MLASVAIAIIVIIFTSIFVGGKVEEENIANQENSMSEQNQPEKQKNVNAILEEEEQVEEGHAEEAGSVDQSHKDDTTNPSDKEQQEETSKNEIANTSEKNTKKTTTEASKNVNKQTDNSTVNSKTTSKSTSNSKTTTTKTSTSTKSIPFKTIEQNDSSLEKGKKKVTQEGKNGVRTITYEETYVDGKLTSKKELSSKVTTKPVDKIVKVGTKDPANVWYDFTLEVIKFKVIEQKDPTLEKGKWKVVQEGRIGEQKTTFKNTEVEGELLPRVEVVSKDVIVQQPINKIVKVGTKNVPASTVFQSADKANQMLTSSGLFKKYGDNVYNFYFTGWTDLEFQVEIGKDHVKRIYFDGLTYNSWKYATKEELIEVLGPEEAEESWAFYKRESKRLESAIRTAANAVYGSGTPEANSLYKEIMNEGTNRYFIRDF